MESRKRNFLTILLIILIVIIVGIIGYLGFEIVNGNIKETQAADITDEFDSQIPTITEEELEELENGSEENTENQNNTTSTEQNNQSNGQTSTSGTGSSSSSSGGSSSGVYISGYWVVGTIRIPATGIKYSIFSQPNRQALEKGVGVLYTSNGLNQVGNTVIAGHNYRNKLFFSKNKNLKIGDKIIIKDTSGVEVTYIIYNTFITNSTDASFYQRDTAGKREITLTTCTDQGTKTGERLIIEAKEQ